MDFTSERRYRKDRFIVAAVYDRRGENTPALIESPLQFSAKQNLCPIFQKTFFTLTITAADELQVNFSKCGFNQRTSVSPAIKRFLPQPYGSWPDFENAHKDASFLSLRIHIENDY